MWWDAGVNPLDNSDWGGLREDEIIAVHSAIVRKMRKVQGSSAVVMGTITRQWCRL